MFALEVLTRSTRPVNSAVFEPISVLPWGSRRSFSGHMDTHFLFHIYVLGTLGTWLCAGHWSSGMKQIQTLASLQFSGKDRHYTSTQINTWIITYGMSALKGNNRGEGMGPPRERASEASRRWDLVPIPGHFPFNLLI